MQLVWGELSDIECWLYINISAKSSAQCDQSPIFGCNNLLAWSSLEEREKTQLSLQFCTHWSEILIRIRIRVITPIPKTFTPVTSIPTTSTPIWSTVHSRPNGIRRFESRLFEIRRYGTTTYVYRKVHCLITQFISFYKQDETEDHNRKHSYILVTNIPEPVW